MKKARKKLRRNDKRAMKKGQRSSVVEVPMSLEEALRLWDTLIDRVHTGNATPAEAEEDPDDED